MNSKSTLAAAVAALAFALGTGPAFGHGGDDHKKSGPVNKEQQPWGIAGDAKAASRTVRITMSDAMRFDPSALQVKQGETVRFVVQNKAQVLHEMVIGTRDKLDEHAALMARFPTMEHDDPSMAHIGAGKQSELVWKFNRPGDFEFACLIAGHYQAGMVGTIHVSK